MLSSSGSGSSGFSSLLARRSSGREADEPRRKVEFSPGSRRVGEYWPKVLLDTFHFYRHHSPAPATPASDVTLGLATAPLLLLCYRPSSSNCYTYYSATGPVVSRDDEALARQHGRSFLPSPPFLHFYEQPHFTLTGSIAHSLGPGFGDRAEETCWLGRGVELVYQEVQKMYLLGERCCSK